MKELIKRIEKLERELAICRAMLSKLPVRLPNYNTIGGIVVGTLNEALSHGGKASMSVYNVDPDGGLLEDTGTDVDIIDPQIIGVGMLIEGSVVVIGARHQGTVVLISYEACPVEDV